MNPTVTGVVVPTLPTLFVAVTMAVNNPLPTYTCDATAFTLELVTTLPSPKSHTYVIRLPAVCVAVKVVTRPNVVGLSFTALSPAILTSTCTTVVAVLISTLLVAVTVAVYVPNAPYACVITAPLSTLCAPSPKSQS